MTEWTEPHRWVSRELITAGKLNTHTDAILWLKENLGAGTFLGLTDTPDTYQGAGGKVVAVKATEDGLEFVAGGGMAAHDKTYHLSPTLPDDDAHRVGDPIDHPNGSIPPVKLKAINSPSGGQVPSYHATTGNFEWITPAGGPDWTQYLRSGRWYYGIPISGGYGATTLEANKLYALSFFVAVTSSWNAIGTYISSGSPGRARLGVYADDGTVYPGNLILDAGEIDTTTAGVKTIDIDLTLEPGLYWIAVLCNATPSFYGLSWYYVYGCLGAVNPGGSQANCYWVSYEYGSLPSQFPAGGSIMTQIHWIALRKA